MKSVKLITAAIVVVFSSLAVSATAMGFLPPEELSDGYSASKIAELGLQKCESNQKVPGQACYISGGIGVDEVAEFKALAKDYPLEMVFVQKADTEDNNRIEEYLAEVQLKIKDAKGNLILDIVTDGPFFLADLPAGKYQIILEHDEVVKTDVVHVSAKKHQRSVYLWNR